ncbi:hypothetical protein RHSIM_Rhsim01G0154200 [Rhododendron simsii]|uniref:Zinc finger-XS domain-containing protein n=1 Tax=Rhododendron simsii TaxID=118357 RepID=A0A834LXI7_RHOSS|nr:hypothetical protein RHSIM_Rhsim01G0154200 [Rhododendron simsii]
MENKTGNLSESSSDIRKKKQQFKYRDLVQHASGVGSGAVWRKPKLKAQHLALAVYLTSDLAHEAEG